MDGWEHDLTDRSSGGAGRRRSLGVLIVAASALATLMLILWFLTNEIPGLALNY
jgi:hypothetical protein